MSLCDSLHLSLCPWGSLVYLLVRNRLPTYTLPLLVHGSHYSEQTKRLSAAWGECLQRPLWEKVQQDFLFSCLWHSVHGKGEKESGVEQAAEIMSLGLAHHTSAGELKCSLHF